MEKEFNISEAEANKKVMMTNRSQLYANLKAKKESYQLDIQDKIREDNNYGTFISFIAAYFYDNEVEFRMTQYGTHAASFKLRFARKGDITDYSRQSKEFALKNNIELGDVYKFEGPGTGANLLEHIKTFNVVEYVDALRYFAVQFEERGELVQMIKGFYLEYFEYMEEISEAETKLSMLDYEIRKYYEALYTKEIVEGDYIKAGNIIVAHNKSSEFILFESIHLEKAGPINTTCTFQGLRFDQTYNSFGSGKQRFYLKLDRGRYSSGVLKREQLIKILVSHKMAGDRVQIYTQQEFNDYHMLIETEKNNLVSNEDKYYDELSKHYESVYRKER